MGDKCRNKVLRDFVRKYFPKVQRICVVADGNGELSALLHDAGYAVRMVEPNPRHLKRRTGIKYEKRCFKRTDTIKEDLIIGMHPDEATVEILFAALTQKKHFILVPCCVVGDPAYTRNVNGYHAWIRKLRGLAGGPTACEHDILPIDGANRVLFRKEPRHV